MKQQKVPCIVQLVYDMGESTFSSLKHSKSGKQPISKQSIKFEPKVNSCA